MTTALRPGRMRVRRWLLGLGLLGASLAPASAARGQAILSAPVSAAEGQGTRPAPPTLTELLAIAARQNPDIQAARHAVDSVRGEQQIARSFPNPTVAYSPGVPSQYLATQDIDVGPDRLYRTRAAGHAKEASAADVQDVVRRVTFAVRTGYYDLLLANALLEVSREERDIVRQLLAADSVRLTQGDVAARDVAKTELEAARADAAFAKALAAVHATGIALQVLLGVTHPDTAFTVAGDLHYRPVNLSEDSIAALAAVHRPDLQAAEQRIAQGHALHSLATANLFPTPALSLVYQPSVPFASGSNYALGIGFIVPLFNWNSGQRTRSRAGLEAAELNRQRVGTQVLGEVATALDSVRATRALAERYESGLLAKARGVLETAQYAYRSGAVSLLDLLDAIRVYGSTRADYYTAVHDYWVSLAAIDRAVGQDVVP